METTTPVAAVASNPADDRFARFRDLVDIERLQKTKYAVAGVGAIGRQVCLQLATMGVLWVDLYDPDNVEEVNIGSQGYNPDHLGASKVNITQANMVNRLRGAHQGGIRPVRLEQGRMYNYRKFNYPFTKTSDCGEVFFCCVDSMRSRRFIYEALRDRDEDDLHGKPALFIDARMAGESFRLLVVDMADESSRESYEASLYGDEQAQQQGCTVRSTFYCATMAASWAVQAMVRYLREFPSPRDMNINTLTAEMTVHRDCSFEQTEEGRSSEAEQEPEVEEEAEEEEAEPESFGAAASRPGESVSEDAGFSDGPEEGEYEDADEEDEEEEEPLEDFMAWLRGMETWPRTEFLSHEAVMSLVERGYMVQWNFSHECWHVLPTPYAHPEYMPGDHGSAVVRDCGAFFGELGAYSERLGGCRVITWLNGASPCVADQRGY